MSTCDTDGIVIRTDDALTTGDLRLWNKRFGGADRPTWLEVEGRNVAARVFVHAPGRPTDPTARELRVGPAGRAAVQLAPGEVVELHYLARRLTGTVDGLSVPTGDVDGRTGVHDGGSATARCTLTVRLRDFDPRPAPGANLGAVRLGAADHTDGAIASPVWAPGYARRAVLRATDNMTGAVYFLSGTSALEMPTMGALMVGDVEVDAWNRLGFTAGAGTPTAEIVWFA